MTDAPIPPWDAYPDHLCEGCGEPLDASEVSVEAFKLSGKILCSDCAEGVFEDNGQFGVGA